jgi:hypothetical protein
MTLETLSLCSVIAIGGSLLGTILLCFIGGMESDFRGKLTKEGWAIIKPSSIILIIIAILGISGAVYTYPLNEYTVLENKTVSVELVAIASQPKHFYVDIKDLENNQIIKRVYVSKHFNKWRLLPFHVPFQVRRVTRQYDNRTGKPINVSYQGICDGLYLTLP